MAKLMPSLEILKSQSRGFKSELKQIDLELRALIKVTNDPELPDKIKKFIQTRPRGDARISSSRFLSRYAGPYQHVPYQYVDSDHYFGLLTEVYPNPNPEHRCSILIHPSWNWGILTQKQDLIQYKFIVSGLLWVVPNFDILQNHGQKLYIDQTQPQCIYFPDYK